MIKYNIVLCSIILIIHNFSCHNL